MNDENVGVSHKDYDAEGVAGEEACPECGSLQTVTYHFREGFTELECRACGYSSEREDITELTRYRGELRERGREGPPVPVKKLEA